jgi:hypothetical protein
VQVGHDVNPQKAKDKALGERHAFTQGAVDESRSDSSEKSEKPSGLLKYPQLRQIIKYQSISGIVFGWMDGGGAGIT